MLLAAAVLMLGYCIIDSKNLYAETVDFGGNGGSLAAAADALNAEKLGGLMPPFNLGGVHVVAAWFVVTGVQTYRTATGNPRNLTCHKHWAIRHGFAGLWVAFQRPL